MSSYTREQEQTALRRLHRMDVRNASAWQSSGCVAPDEPTLEGILASVIAERDALQSRVDGYERDFPCDGGCSYGDGPQEDCSLHGRNPRELWATIGGLQAECDRAVACIEKTLKDHNPRDWRPQDGIFLGSQVCDRCRETWPCRTVRILTEYDKEADRG